MRFLTIFLDGDRTQACERQQQGGLNWRVSAHQPYRQEIDYWGEIPGNFNYISQKSFTIYEPETKETKEPVSLNSS